MSLFVTPSVAVEGPLTKTPLKEEVNMLLKGTDLLGLVSDRIPVLNLRNVVYCSSAKKSARPLTSSCVPSVTSIVPIWDYQTAASTQRYHHICQSTQLCLRLWEQKHSSIQQLKKKSYSTGFLLFLISDLSIILTASCFHFKVTHLFDNGATIFFAVFMAVWGKSYLNKVNFQHKHITSGTF